MNKTDSIKYTIPAYLVNYLTSGDREGIEEKEII